MINLNFLTQSLSDTSCKLQGTGQKIIIEEDTRIKTKQNTQIMREKKKEYIKNNKREYTTNRNK